MGLTRVGGAAAAPGCGAVSLRAIGCGAKGTRTLRVFEEPQQRRDAALHRSKQSAAVHKRTRTLHGACACLMSRSSPGMQRGVAASNRLWCSKDEDVAQGLHLFKELQQPWDATSCRCK